MKTHYLDCFAGISGDMTLGALIDATGYGDRLRELLGGLSVSGEFELVVSKTAKNGIAGTDVDVVLHEHHGHEHRSLSHVTKIIEDAALPQAVKATATAIFTELAHAEAAVHGTDVSKVHFHEVGAVDAIVDIVGTAALIHMIAPDEIVCSPINVGSGTVKCAHGVLPVPAPATARLLTGMSVYSRGEGERTTPTGAAILKTLAKQGEIARPMTLSAVGYGFGKRDTGGVNALRAMILEEGGGSGALCVVETNVDDMTGEELAFAQEALLESGARDVWVTPIIMKKGRGAYTLSVLTDEGSADSAAELMFKHTTTLGVRIYPVRRVSLARSEGAVEALGGRVRVKYASGRAKAEYDDAAALARKTGKSLREVKKLVE